MGMTMCIMDPNMIWALLKLDPWNLIHLDWLLDCLIDVEVTGFMEFWYIIYIFKVSFNQICWCVVRGRGMSHNYWWFFSSLLKTLQGYSVLRWGPFCGGMWELGRGVGTHLQHIFQCCSFGFVRIDLKYDVDSATSTSCRMASGGASEFSELIAISDSFVSLI